MKEVKKSLKKLTKPSNPIKSDPKLTKMVQDFTLEMEEGVTEISPSQIKEDEDAKIAYFIEVFNAVSRNDAFPSIISLDQIRATLNAAIPNGCICNPKSPGTICPPEISIKKLVESYVERLQELRNSGNEI
jgi:hypothetical protein